MNHIEAMKQALEALEEIHHGNMTPMAETNWNKAITALRQAIAQAEKQELHKREWIGLTDEEIGEAFEQMSDYEMYNEFSLAVEAKLKEKNYVS